MNERIQQLLNQITALEDELRVSLAEQQSNVFFQIKGKRIEFNQSIKETHLRLKNNFFSGQLASEKLAGTWFEILNRFSC